MHKSTRPFSAIAIDHAHKQNNAVVKGDGGAIGLTQNPRALLRRMVAGPEIARTIEGFETACLDNHTGRDIGRHYEHTMAVQVTFASEVQALVEVIEDLGNPFMEESGDLLVLDTRDIADPTVVTTVRGIEKKGHDQFDSFVTDRLVEPTSPVSDTISKNSMPLARVTRVDIIWAVYIPESLKSTARENRGKGVRRRVAAVNSIPGNWQEFLRVDENKTELFSFLAHEVVENLSTEKEVFSTCGKHVLCSRVHQDVSALAPCSHEEADTRMFLHAKDAAEKGHRRIMLRTVDTDVVDLAVSTVVSMENTQLWIAFGTGKHLRYIPAHEIATSLGAEKAQALPMFHAFTGCGTVSSFAGKGKKTAFDTWRLFNAATEVFARLFTRPTSLDNVCMSVLES